jgi:DNA-binding MarR family transcriptional regulator
MRKRKQKKQPSTEEVADRLHSAAIHLLRRVRKQDSATGEGPARLSALSVLVFGGPSTLGQLAAAEQVRPPTMSRIVAALQASDLVEIIPDPSDARRIQIRATTRGIQLLNEGRRCRVTSLAAQLEAFSPSELEILKSAADLIERVSRNWKTSNEGS